MLVKKSIVEKWYQTDSWVYKNFAYLFQNPLWAKRIPNGFSVCPYFWLNIFSLLIFRPFIVFPIQYFILPIMRLIGKPARIADEAIFKFVKRILKGSADYAPGMGLLAGLVFGFLATMVVGIVIIGVVRGYQFYNYLTLTHAGTFVFWSMASFLALFGVIASHKAITKTECKTMYYLFLWLALFIPAAAFIVPAESWSLVSGFGSGVATFFGLIFSGIWIALTFVAKWAWFGIVVAATWTPVPAFYIPWWGYFVGLAIIGWIVSKSTVYVEEKNINTLRHENPSELYSRFRAMWLSDMLRLIVVGKRWKNDSIVYNEFESYTAAAVVNYRTILFKQTLEKMFGEKLNELQSHFPYVKGGTWEAIVKADVGTDSRFVMYKNGLEQNSDLFPQMDVEKFICTLKQIVNADMNVKRLAAQYRSEDESKRAKAEARKQSWSHVTCLKFTTAIAETVHNVGRGLKTIGSNTVTFTAYMWMLLKAKKQGACPYFKFNAPLPPTAPKKSGVKTHN